MSVAIIIIYNYYSYTVANYSEVLLVHNNIKILCNARIVTRAARCVITIRGGLV